MERTMINTELLEQTMRHIIDNPQAHDQTIWATECGTTACFAGWACLLSGAKPQRWLWEWDDTLWQMPHLAERLLKLESLDASELFDAENTIDDLQNIVKTLINNAHTPEGEPS
jgi:hypothetical protein